MRASPCVFSLRLSVRVALLLDWLAALALVDIWCQCLAESTLELARLRGRWSRGRLCKPVLSDVKPFTLDRTLALCAHALPFDSL